MTPASLFNLVGIECIYLPLVGYLGIGSVQETGESLEGYGIMKLPGMNR